MDIQQATQIAREMVMNWGMGDQIGLINYSGDSMRDGYYFGPSNDYSQKTAELIDQEIKKIVDRAYSDSRNLIETHRDKLEGIAKALLKYETLDSDEVKIILEGGKLEKPTVGELLAQEQQKTHPPSGDTPAATAS